MSQWLMFGVFYLCGVFFYLGLIALSLRDILSGELVVHFPKPLLGFMILFNCLTWPYPVYLFLSRKELPDVSRFIAPPIQPQMPEEDPPFPTFDEDPPELNVDCPCCNKTTPHTLVWRCDVCDAVYDDGETPT